MPYLARKSGGNAARQSHLISRCIKVIVQSVATVELQKVHLYSRARAPAPKDEESSRWPAWC